MMSDKRNYEFKNSNSKDGTKSTMIYRAQAERLVAYCKLKNLNVTHYVNECIDRCLIEDYTKTLQDMSKDDLIEMIKKNGNIKL